MRYPWALMLIWGLNPQGLTGALSYKTVTIVYLGKKATLHDQVLRP